MAETELDELARIDAIVAKITKEDPEPAPVAAAPEVKESEAAPADAEVEDDAAPPAEEPAVSSEETEAEPAELQPVIAPPDSWDEAAKAEFAQIPRNVQEKILAREADVQRALSDRGRKSAEIEKELEQAKNERLQYAQHLKSIHDNALLGDPIIAFGRKADWAAIVRENPTEGQIAYHEWQKREKALSDIQRERAGVMAKAQSDAVTSARSKLSEQLGDEFTDDVKWKTLAREIGDYLAEKGVPRNLYQGIEDRQITNPAELLVVVDAVKGRRLLKAKQTLPTKKVAPPVRTAAKPRAVESAPQANKPLQARINRARQTGKDDDRIAAVLAAING